MNPSDNGATVAGGKSLVYSNYVNKIDLDANVENVRSQSRKAYRKELKRKRMEQGDAASGDFQGPWAIYEGME